jgi:hypothetical protein
MFRAGFQACKSPLPRSADVLELEAFAEALRSSKPLAPLMPHLRQAHNAILASAGAAADQYTLINTETDRIITSLNTLREQIARLLRA